MADTKDPIVAMRDIQKAFGGVRALKGVDLDIYLGEVHALVGLDPPRPVGVAAGAVVERGDVVAQCVPPHVDDLRRISWDGDAPVARTPP